MKNYTAHFRPIYEVWGVVGWLFVAIALPVTDKPYGWITALLALGAASLRGRQVWRALEFRFAISTKWLTKIGISELLQAHAGMRRSKDSMFLGIGFEWTQKHCQIAHEIMRMPTNEIPGLPKWLGSEVEQALERVFAPKNSIRDTMPQGASWIYGMEHKKQAVPLHYKALGGHTAVAGTTGAGKTRAYEVISTQVIHLGDVLIIVDPKNDANWKKRVEKECKRANRKFLYFNQAKPSESVRINPLENWSQPSEIPGRIAQLMDEGPFRDFGFLFIDRSVKGELYVGDKPTLRSILKYAQSGVAQLLDRALKKFFVETGFHDWEMQAAANVQRTAQNRAAGPVDSLVELYNTRYGAHDLGHEVIDGLISTYTHDRDHYMKVIATTLPLLQMLASGETGLMMSPKADDFEDEREIWDIDKVIRQKAVLYIGLDSLSNSVVSKAIASMLLADVAAVCGAIYNFYDSPPDVVLMIDELAEAINEQVIQILNKGRGAGFKAFVAFQSRSDIEARLGMTAKMMQVLGNLNNQFVLRLEDTDTAQWFSEKVGETAIRYLTGGSSTGTGSEAHALEFSGNVSKSETLEKVPLIPVELIQRLPNLQYFLRVSGSAVYHGRIPIIVG